MAQHVGVSFASKNAQTSFANSSSRTRYSVFLNRAKEAVQPSFLYIQSAAQSAATKGTADIGVISGGEIERAVLTVYEQVKDDPAGLLALYAATTCVTSKDLPYVVPGKDEDAIRWRAAAIHNQLRGMLGTLQREHSRPGRDQQGHLPRRSDGLAGEKLLLTSTSERHSSHSP